jgi:hypothetical protein
VFCLWYVCESELRTLQAGALVVVALCAGLMAIVVGVPQSIINGWRQVPAIRASHPTAVPATVPALQKTGTPFPILPAIPPAPGSVPGNYPLYVQSLVRKLFCSLGHFRLLQVALLCVQSSAE